METFLKFKTIRFEMSNDGKYFFNICELEEAGIQKLLSSGKSSLEILKTFYFSCLKMLHDGFYKDFRFNIWNGTYWFLITHSLQTPSEEGAFFLECDELELIAEQIKFQNLTRTEKEILLHFSKGNTHDQIIKLMNTSEETFRVHLKRIYKKLGIHSKSELFIWLKKFGCHLLTRSGGYLST